MINALLLALLALPAAAAPAKLDYASFAALHDRLINKAVAKDLDADLPKLAKNIKGAVAVSAQHWTDCTVFDELAKAEILDERVMKGLGIRREVTGGVAHAPAGVMHTYGYLFSQLKTAYGLKGKRWIESRLDERLGLRAGVFSPLTKDGEFTANVTTVLLSVIGAPAKVAGAAKLQPVLQAIGHVEQRVTWKTTKGETVKAEVMTYLTRLTPLADMTTTDEYLLVYAVRRDGKVRLTTAFPVGKGFADGIMATKPDAEAAFKPRYNLYVDPAWTVAAQENLGWKAD